MKQKIDKQISYFLKLTDKIGIIEHCCKNIPDYSEGYCVDDNARALQVCLRLKKQYPILEKVLPIYFNFLKSAWKNEKYYNDVDEKLVWKEDFFINGEHRGRTLSVLGEMINFNQNNDEVKKMFDQIYKLIKSNKTEYIRVIAQTILGLQYYRQNEIKFWADKLVDKYHLEKTSDWKWFEEIISYDIGRMPLALITAYKITNDYKYLDVGITSLDFLTEKILDKRLDCFVFPGNKGWITKSGVKNIFDQQPIEAGSIIEVYCLAFKITKIKKYYDLALKAFDWYKGKNIIKAKMIDQKTGGVYDGFSYKKVNRDQGSESVMAYLLGYDAIQKIDQKGPLK